MLFVGGRARSGDVQLKLALKLSGIYQNRRKLGVEPEIESDQFCGWIHLQDHLPSPRSLGLPPQNDSRLRALMVKHPGLALRIEAKRQILADGGAQRQRLPDPFLIPAMHQR